MEACPPPVIDVKSTLSVHYGRNSRSSPHVGGCAAGDAHQLVEGRREDVVRVATRGPHLVVLPEIHVDECADGRGVAHGSDSANGEPGCCPHVVGIGFGDLRSTQHGGKALCIDSMLAGGDHQNRCTVGEEDQGARDLTNLNVECCGRLLRSAGAVVQSANLARGAESGQGFLDENDGLLKGVLNHSRERNRILFALRMP